MVTWTGLLCAIGALLGIVISLLAGLTIFAGGMSDAPQEGEKAANAGCFILLCGIALFALSLWGIL